MDSLIIALQQQGMSSKEAKVYLTTLELGSAPASTIARRSGLKRVTVYAILKELETQGTALRVERNAVAYFHVIEPQKLLKRLEQKAASFQAVLPQLAAMMGQYDNKPQVQYFQGVNGMKEMYSDLLSSQSGISSWLGCDEVDEELYKYLREEFMPQRIALDIHARVILPQSQENAKYSGYDHERKKESLVIAHDAFTMPSTEINLYGPNKVMIAIIAPKELSGYIIASPTLYQSLNSIFELLWQTHGGNTHGKK